MGRNIQVTPDQLETAASRIDSLAENYKTQYELLYSETSAMASSWKGKDNVAFVEQIAGFKDDFQKMYTLMTKYSEFLKQSAKTYRNTQDEITANAKKLAQ